MDYAMLLDHLEQAKRHIAEGEVHIDKQKKILAKLERGHLSSDEERLLLYNFEDAQRQNLADLDRIFDELNQPELRT